MSDERDFKHGATAQENGTETHAEPERLEHHPTKRDIDEEIHTLEERSRRSRQEIVPPPELPPAPPRKALMVVGAFLLVLLAAGAISVGIRLSHSRALAKETERGSIATVLTVHPKAEAPDEELVLPGSLQAFKESPIFARTSGYLVQWYKDIGSRVKQGDLLAKIDTPEVDQELNQARAARQQILAQMQLAKISADRWENLRKTDSVSQQETDQQTSGYQQAQANLAAADANVRRLEQLESFKNVYAPFPGVLTRRNVDPGALINAGAGGQPMFNLAQVDPLRVFTSVPQAYAPYIRVGAKATVTLQEFPGQKFQATIARTSDSIDPTTRTLLTEVDVPNKDGRLLPGSYGQVHFAVPSDVHKLVIPVNAMLFRAEGPRVGVVGADGKVHLQPINIGRDYGSTLEILGGLNEQDRIIVNPSDSLEEGQQVNVANSKEAAPQGVGAGTQAKGQ
ncbi:MAG TPA: efflux RND transporter periplasmic adaptor subunit [candidate division Zixibacteria bacterium]|nr:efflux RND transporter periplasmic adaptor subunit [candidate division Zixibacteria bacterium]